MHALPLSRLTALAVAALVGSPLLAAPAAPDPCRLVSAAEVASSLGALREPPRASTDPGGDKRCTFTSERGTWAAMRSAPADQFGLARGETSEMGQKPADGLGDEAFEVARGGTVEVYARAGDWMVEVACSAGAGPARDLARLAVARLQSSR